MKYLCVARDGSLEIWERFEDYDTDGVLNLSWKHVFYREGEIVTLDAKIPGRPEFWGREIVEEWVDDE